MAEGRRRRSAMKVATWNVNGIRAREAQFVEWVRRDQPDVVCLQEIKATAEQLGETLTMLPEYWSYWHGGPKGYSGVSLHVRKDVVPGAARVQPPGVRRREPRRAGRGSTGGSGGRERVRPQRRQGLRRRSCASSRRCAPTSHGVHAGGRQA